MYSFFRVRDRPPVEFVLDLDDYVGVYIWLSQLGGHWVIYLGRKDKSPLLIDDKDWHGEVTGGHTHQGIRMPGCDTAHAGDENFGPDGELGWKMESYAGRPMKRWDVPGVQAHLRELVEKDMSLRGHDRTDGADSSI